MTRQPDPDVLLAEIMNFITGHSTTHGYAAFADTVRALHNHIVTGGKLPVAWQPRGRFNRDRFAAWLDQQIDATASGVTDSAYGHYLSGKMDAFKQVKAQLDREG